MPPPDASINWHYSNHSCPHTKRQTQSPLHPPKSRLHEPIHSLHRESATSTVCWLSQPTSPAIYSTFFQPATVDEAIAAPPCMSSHFSPHNILTFIQEKEHTPSSNTIALSCPYPPFSTPDCLLHGKPGKATPAPTRKYINLFCSTVLHCLFWLLKDRLETEQCWVSMEEGCGWCRERLFVAQLETAFISPPLYSIWTSELLEVFIFYVFSLYANIVCDSILLKWGDYIERAQVEMLFASI